MRPKALRARLPWHVDCSSPSARNLPSLHDNGAAFAPWMEAS